MIQNRFNTLSILHIEKQISRNINNEEILKKISETELLNLKKRIKNFTISLKKYKSIKR
jgi:hypothetical protein